MMNSKLFLPIFLSMALVATQAMCLTEEQLKGLDEETRNDVLAEQERIKAESASRKEREQQRLRLKEEVFSWPLSRKIEVLNNGVFPKPEIDEVLVQKMLHAQLSREYGIRWAEDSPEMKPLRGQMEALRPYIIQLSKSGRSADKSYAVTFGRYLQIDESTESMFYEVLDSKLADNESGVREVLDVIFAYDLDTPELRDELVQGLHLANGSENQSRFTSEAEFGAGRWNLFEAVNPLMDLVEDHYKLKGKANRTALKSLKELGASAVDVLPRLEKLLEMRLADGDADFREIEALEYAILSVSKGLPKETETTPLSSIESIEEVIAPEPAIEEPAEVVVAAPIKEDVEQSPNWWLWLVGAVVVIGGILKVCRKK